jgi:amino acid transporter
LERFALRRRKTALSISIVVIVIIVIIVIIIIIIINVAHLLENTTHTLNITIYLSKTRSARNFQTTSERKSKNTTKPKRDTPQYARAFVAVTFSFLFLFFLEEEKQSDSENALLFLPEIFSSIARNCFTNKKLNETTVVLLRQSIVF